MTFDQIRFHPATRQITVEDPLAEAAAWAGGGQPARTERAPTGLTIGHVLGRGYGLEVGLGGGNGGEQGSGFKGVEEFASSDVVSEIMGSR